jgi:hypothetical protein
LSRRYTLLTQLEYKIFGLETIKDQYVHDAGFKDMLLHCKGDKTWNKFIFNDGFVFRANKLCIPASSTTTQKKRKHTQSPLYVVFLLFFAFFCFFFLLYFFYIFFRELQN